LIKHLFVWVRRPEGAIRLVGELATTAPDRNSGRFESEFEYTRAWASEAGAFALDPVSLPLDAARRFRAEMLYPPLAVFDDALPDDWGRRLLAAAISADGGTPTLPEMLLRMRAAGDRHTSPDMRCSIGHSCEHPERVERFLAHWAASPRVLAKKSCNGHKDSCECWCSNRTNATNARSCSTNRRAANASTTGAMRSTASKRSMYGGQSTVALAMNSGHASRLSSFERRAAFAAILSTAGSMPRRDAAACRIR
jgi:hypothetical protein